MWSNLNDSFSAISGHISQLRQSIPSIQSLGDEGEDSQHDELTTKIDLLRAEVSRQRRMGKIYKERWVHSEQTLKNATGQCSKIYQDEVDLGQDEEEIDLDDSDDQNAPHSTSIEKQDGWRLDSATKTILQLKSEVKKLEADRQHWRMLAKQKTPADHSHQQLAQLDTKLKQYQIELDSWKRRCQELEQKCQHIEVEARSELQQLDALHEQETTKILAIRDQLQEEVKLLKNNATNQPFKHDNPTDVDMLLEMTIQIVSKQQLDNGHKKRLMLAIERLHRALDLPVSLLNSLDHHGLKKVEDELSHHDDSDNASPPPSSFFQHEDVHHLQPTVLEREEPEGVEQRRVSGTAFFELSNQQERNNDDSTKIDYEKTLEKLDSFTKQFESLKVKFECFHETTNTNLKSLEQSLLQAQTKQKIFSQAQQDSLRIDRLRNEELKAIFTNERDDLKEKLADVEIELIKEKEMALQLRNQISQLETESKNNEWENRFKSCEQKLLTMSDEYEKMKTALARKDEELIDVRESMQQVVSSQNAQTSDQVDQLKSELTRLKGHLVEVEETYTAYLTQSEAKFEQANEKLREYEKLIQKEAQVEKQMESLKTERDKARNEAQRLEDRVERFSTNISNLQGVIEQLEKEHERTIRSLNADHRAQLDAERHRNEEVMRKWQSCEQRLKETVEALSAASRLSETIDQKEVSIGQLKRELNKRDHLIQHLQLTIDQLNASTEGKIDKQIVKSLIISYLATPVDKRSDGERLLARVLDFNQEESIRAGVKIGRIEKGDSSFTSKFVEFLQVESKPEIQLKTGQLTTTSNVQQQELARDLNKRLSETQFPLNTGRSMNSKMNPFVNFISITGAAEAVGSTSKQAPAVISEEASSNNDLTKDLTKANIPEIVRDAIEEQEKFI